MTSSYSEDVLRSLGLDHDASSASSTSDDSSVDVDQLLADTGFESSPLKSDRGVNDSIPQAPIIATSAKNAPVLSTERVAVDYVGELSCERSDIDSGDESEGNLLDVLKVVRKTKEEKEARSPNATNSEGMGTVSAAFPQSQDVVAGLAVFTGEWTDEANPGGDVTIIKGDTISWSGGETLSTIKIECQNTFSTQLYDNTYSAHLEASGRLKWDFGGVWVRHHSESATKILETPERCDSGPQEQQLANVTETTSCEESFDPARLDSRPSVLQSLPPIPFSSEQAVHAEHHGGLDSAFINADQSSSISSKDEILKTGVLYAPEIVSRDSPLIPCQHTEGQSSSSGASVTSAGETDLDPKLVEWEPAMPLLGAEETYTESSTGHVSDDNGSSPDLHLVMDTKEPVLSAVELDVGAGLSSVGVPAAVGALNAAVHMVPALEAVSLAPPDPPPSKDSQVQLAVVTPDAIGVAAVARGRTFTNTDLKSAVAPSSPRSIAPTMPTIDDLRQKLQMANRALVSNAAQVARVQDAQTKGRRELKELKGGVARAIKTRQELEESRHRRQATTTAIGELDAQYSNAEARQSELQAELSHLTKPRETLITGDSAHQEREAKCSRKLPQRDASMEALSSIHPSSKEVSACVSYLLESPAGLHGQCSTQFSRTSVIRILQGVVHARRGLPSDDSMCDVAFSDFSPCGQDPVPQALEVRDGRLEVLSRHVARLRARGEALEHRCQTKSAPAHALSHPCPARSGTGSRCTCQRCQVKLGVAAFDAILEELQTRVVLQHELLAGLSVSGVEHSSSDVEWLSSLDVEHSRISTAAIETPSALRQRVDPIDLFSALPAEAQFLSETAKRMDSAVCAQLAAEIRLLRRLLCDAVCSRAAADVDRSKVVTHYRRRCAEAAMEIRQPHVCQRQGAPAAQRARR